MATRTIAKCLFSFVAVCACTVGGPPVLNPQRVSIQLTLGLPAAPSRIVTIDSNERVVDTIIGGTHIGPTRRLSGTLMPGELNDIIASINKSGFWEWSNQTDSPADSATILEVQLGDRRHRIWRPLKELESDQTQLGQVVRQIIAFAQKSSNSAVQPMPTAAHSS